MARKSNRQKRREARGYKELRNRKKKRDSRKKQIGNASINLSWELEHAIQQDHSLSQSIATQLGIRVTDLFKMASGNMPISNHQKRQIKEALREYKNEME